MKKFLSKFLVVAIMLMTFASCSPQNNQNNQNNQTPNVDQNQSQSSTTQNNANSNVIGEEKAKEIALQNANLKAEEVNFVKVYLDQDLDDNDDVLEYEIEFVKDDKEYDYNIDAVTGNIISNSVEKNDNVVNNNNANVKIKDVDAKNIALNHAKLAEKDVKFIKVQLDSDEPVPEYEISFRVNNKEYDYTINANSAEIIDFEVDND